MLTKDQIAGWDYKPEPARHVIVHGPQGCGKTTNARLLALAFGCTVKFEAGGMEPRDLDAALWTFTVPTLFLTDENMSDRELPSNVTVVDFAEAMERASRWYLCAGDEPPSMTAQERTIYEGIKTFCEVAHLNAQTWYFDPVTGQRIERNFGETIALIHSEFSEALEAHRKDLPDDKLPDRPGAEVEFGDGFVRAADTAQYRGYDLAGAIIAKMRYNAIRLDHTPEARAAAGGKAY